MVTSITQADSWNSGKLAHKARREGAGKPTPSSLLAFLTLPQHLGPGTAFIPQVPSTWSAD